MRMHIELEIERHIKCQLFGFDFLVIFYESNVIKKDLTSYRVKP